MPRCSLPHALRAAVAAGFGFVIASGVCAQGTKPGAPAPPSSASSGKALSPENLEKLRKQIDALEKDISQKKRGYNTGLVAKLREAAQSNASAFNFWLECKKEIDFIQKGKTATEFVEWKRGGEAQRLEKSDTFRNSLRLQAQFLVLVVMNSYANTTQAKSEVAAEAMNYLETMVKFCDSEKSLAKSVLGSVIDVSISPDQVVTMSNIEETLKQAREASSAVGGDIMDSLFAKYLKIEGMVGKNASAATHPGNVDEIYERLILPVLREKKDAAGLAAAWTKRMDQMARIAKATGVKELVEKYETEKLPVLKWGQACDQWDAGHEEPAAQAMLAIIRANPAHRETSSWISQLRERAQPKEPGAPGAGAPVKRIRVTAEDDEQP